MQALEKKPVNQKLLSMWIKEDTVRRPEICACEEAMQLREDVRYLLGALYKCACYMQDPDGDLTEPPYFGKLVEITERLDMLEKGPADED
jgi:hypothetical protein